jgi:hypothetical protein
MPGTGSREACAAVRRHKFPICDLVQHDSDVRTAAEEIARGPFFARRRFHHGRAPRLRRTGQSAKAKPCPGDKQNLSRASRLRNEAHIRVRQGQ